MEFIRVGNKGIAVHAITGWHSNQPGTLIINFGPTESDFFGGAEADALLDYLTHHSVDVVTIYRCQQGQHEYGIGEERATCRHCGHFEGSLWDSHDAQDEDYSPADEFASTYPYNLGR